MDSFAPIGCSLYVNVAENGEPVISLVFPLVDEDEPLVVNMTEEAARGCRDLLSTGVEKAAVVREMVTMFPEQREQIIENVLFRWTELPEADDGTT